MGLRHADVVQAVVEEAQDWYTMTTSPQTKFFCFYIHDYLLTNPSLGLLSIHASGSDLRTSIKELEKRKWR